MTATVAQRFLACLALAAAILTSAPAQAEMSAEELAKLAQNPVGNPISVPFQNNTNFNVGPNDGTQIVLNIQPVIPELSAYYFVVHPDYGANWQLRAQVQLMFPK